MPCWIEHTGENQVERFSWPDSDREKLKRDLEKGRKSEPRLIVICCGTKKAFTSVPVKTFYVWYVNKVSLIAPERKLKQNKKQKRTVFVLFLHESIDASGKKSYRMSLLQEVSIHLLMLSRKRKMEKL